MIEVEGLHNKALCFTEHLDEVSKAQIKLVCDQEVFRIVRSGSCRMSMPEKGVRSERR